MKQIKMSKKLLTILCITGILAGCSKSDKPNIDTEYPTIDVTTAQAFPKQCSELVRGQTININILASDNAELGSASIDIHHNFDHHTHSTEVNDCGLDPVKTPVKPFLLIKTLPIPSGNKTYTVTDNITIPADADLGDYHFMIRVTDKEGWQTIKGLSIKIS